MNSNVVNRELYHEIRGVDKYDIVIDNIKAAQELSKENKCNILINAVVCSKNLDQISDVIKLSKKLDVKGIMILQPSMITGWRS